MNGTMNGSAGATRERTKNAISKLIACRLTALTFPVIILRVLVVVASVGRVRASVVGEEVL